MITIRIIQAAIGEANRTKDGRRYLVRGAGNPWSEWLNATSRPLAAETTSLSNLLPDARGPISPVPSETRSFANGGERERGGGRIPCNWDGGSLGRAVEGHHQRYRNVDQLAALVTFTTGYTRRDVARRLCNNRRDPLEIESKAHPLHDFRIAYLNVGAG